MLEQRQRLANELEHTHPGAASALREGIEETLTVIRLRINGQLKCALKSMNPCELMLDCVRTTQRNVKRCHARSSDDSASSRPPARPRRRP